MNHRENSPTQDHDFSHSHHRCFAVVGDGEAHPRSGLSTDRGMLPLQLEILSDAAHNIADRVRRGRMSFLEGVDFIWSAAEWADLVDEYGPDEVQAVLSEAFMGCPRT